MESLKKHWRQYCRFYYEANEFISAAYAEMRQSAAGSKTLPVTPRALETIIRLSSAHAKSRLSRVVEEVDCRVALEKR